MALNSFEKSCFEKINDGWIPENSDVKDDLFLLRFGLWSLIRIGRMIRKVSISPTKIKKNYKKDGSPVTVLDQQIEDFIIKSIHRFIPEISFEGEESGGAIEPKGVSLALDPLDGTGSFLSHSNTSATSLAFFRDGHIVIGMVMNPATGELGYVLNGQKTRLIQFNLFGEKIQAVDLPTIKKEDSEKLLVNFHPYRKANKLAQTLYKGWQEGEINLVKSISGSPAMALLEAAKGHSSYINLWKGPPALSYDLAAGILIVRGAGGEVLDMDGDSIPYIGHQGPFFAGLSPVHLELLRKKLKNI